MRKFILVPLLAILASAPAAHRRTQVQISFSGVICNVFDAEHAPRAVAMRGGGTMLHHATLHMAQESIASSDVPLACDHGDCVLDLANTALRFPGAGRAHYDAGGSYDTIVPHLRAVTNGEMSALRDEVFDDVPSPSSVISASMVLPSGSLTAVAFDIGGHYEPDLEGRGERAFPRQVLFNGTAAAPQLLVRRFGDAAWRRIPFNDDIDLRMMNDPAPGVIGIDHALLFYDLAATPLTAKPVIVRSPLSGDPTIANIDVYCSSSGYP